MNDRTFDGIPPFTATIESCDRSIHVGIQGELDMATVPLFDELLLLVAEQAEETVIDLGNLSFVDASGLHAFAEARARADRTHRRFVMVNVPRHARRLFEITDTLYLLEDREEMRMSTRETPDDEERASAPGQKGDGSLEPGSWPERENGDDSGMGNAGRGKEPAEIEEGA